MTRHQPIHHSDRTSLPRGLIGRRFVTLPTESYEFKFAMGQLVRIECTDELAEIVGRIQTRDCVDDYIIEILHADCAPLQVAEYQISAA